MLALIATDALVGTSFAQYGQGKGQGSGMRQGRTDRTIVDTNNNGIADGQEDCDNDGVINRDDSDYERSYVNARDDGDGIPNSQDFIHSFITNISKYHFSIKKENKISLSFIMIF